jgi:hypothetical protein
MQANLRVTGTTITGVGAYKERAFTTIVEVMKIQALTDSLLF